MVVIEMSNEHSQHNSYAIVHLNFFDDLKIILLTKFLCEVSCYSIALTTLFPVDLQHGHGTEGHLCNEQF